MTSAKSGPSAAAGVARPHSGPVALEGKVAVVIGASQGIGLACAAELSSRGCKVVGVARRPATLAKAASSVNMHPLAWDSTAEDAGRAVHDEVLRSHGRMDILINSAGLVRHAALADSRVEDFDAMYATYLRGPWQIVRECADELVRNSGQIVFLGSSITRSNSIAGRAQYAAIQAGQLAMAQGLREELNPRNVRVLTVTIGSTATPTQARIHAEFGKRYQPDALLQPEDVARCIADALTMPYTAEVTDIHVRPMHKS